MHYKNGRPALENDPVVYPGQCPGWKARAGTLHSLNTACDTCNGKVSVATPGGVETTLVNVNDGYHADDALAAVEPKLSIVQPEVIDVESTAVTEKDPAPAQAPAQENGQQSSPANY